VPRVREQGLVAAQGPRRWGFDSAGGVAVEVVAGGGEVVAGGDGGVARAERAGRDGTGRELEPGQILRHQDFVLVTRW
jgi:hypothetical protein